MFTSSVSYELWTYPSLREELLATPERWLGLPFEEARKIGTGLLGEPLDVGSLHMTLLPGTQRGPRRQALPIDSRSRRSTNDRGGLESADGDVSQADRRR